VYSDEYCQNRIDSLESKIAELYRLIGETQDRIDGLYQDLSRIDHCPFCGSRSVEHFADSTGQCQQCESEYTFHDGVVWSVESNA